MDSSLLINWLMGFVHSYKGWWIIGVPFKQTWRLQGLLWYAQSISTTNKPCVGLLGRRLPTHVFWWGIDRSGKARISIGGEWTYKPVIMGETAPAPLHQHPQWLNIVARGRSNQMVPTRNVSSMLDESASPKALIPKMNHEMDNSYFIYNTHMCVIVCD